MGSLKIAGKIFRFVAPRVLVLMGACAVMTHAEAALNREPASKISQTSKKKKKKTHGKKKKSRSAAKVSKAAKPKVGPMGIKVEPMDLDNISREYSDAKAAPPPSNEIASSEDEGRTRVMDGESFEKLSH